MLYNKFIDNLKKEQDLFYLIKFIMSNLSFLLNIFPSGFILEFYKYIVEFDYDYDHIPILTKIFSLNYLLIGIEEYWTKIQLEGFGVREIDEFVTFIVLTRLIILSLRYNLRTSLIITTISAIAGYLWYSTFINMLFRYEQSLYGNSLTMRLGIDSMQIRRIFQGRMKRSDYQIRLTNPVGILLYSIEMGSRYDGHRIDLVSMVMANFSKHSDQFLPQFYDIFEEIYYFIYRKAIPILTRTSLNVFDSFRAYAMYSIITRVGRKYCPYLIRWHWTFIIILKFLDTFLFCVVGRIGYYSINTVYPAILARQEFNLNCEQLLLEMRFLNYMKYSIIICQLFFLLYGMLHALCGQYFYVPLLTRTVELNIGLRDKLDIYSGGYTAWQDDRDFTKGFKIKFWYGWFGRGTNNSNNIFRQFIKVFKRFLKKFISR